MCWGPGSARAGTPAISALVCSPASAPNLSPARVLLDVRRDTARATGRQCAGGLGRRGLVLRLYRLWFAHRHRHRIYRQRAYYWTYDVTPLVQPGGNVLGAWVGEGWYSGYIGFGLLTGIGTESIGSARITGRTT